MVRGRRGGRRWGARGGGATPPVASMPEGYNPQGDEKVVEQEKIVVGDVVRMMRSFQLMFEALMNHFDRDEARALTPTEVPPRALVSTSGVHRELEKVKFLSSLVPHMAQPPRHGWRTWICALHFVIIPPT